MNMYIVSYTFHDGIARAFLNLDTKKEIKPLLSQYHRVPPERIEIKKVQEVPATQKFMYVQYFD